MESTALRLGTAGEKLLFTEARTVKRFSPTPVGDDRLAGIWDLARWPPTSSNIQPLRVLFVRTAEGFGRLLPHLPERNREQARTAPVTAVLALDRDYHEPAAPHLNADEVHRLDLGRFSAALQAGYFILAVRAAGLHAGPMGGFDHDGVDREFFPDGRCTALLLVNIGHPAAENPWRERQPRLPVDRVLRWA
ncbi:malonic semialdehyde reductase [Amycolatopsis sp. NPDC088138]|uniref:malonic semialdehyde reductase n=1 Tax=Amycolatopsis sp. NPDC088138 TaxID=3363938 RepID=UPI0037FE2FDC